jgi:pimeloyl-ACP methyl ester carboxylesterase
VISSRYMVPVGRLLARRHRVLAPDLPGFGWSSHPPAVLAVPALAEVLARFIELEVRGPAVVLGNSFGCQVSAQLAADRPDLVDRLILVSPTFDPHASLLRHVLRLLGDAPRERLDLWLLQVPDYVLAGPRTIIGTLRAARRHRIERVLPHIPAPTLVVRGSRDTIVPAAWAAEAASLLPEGAAEELPGAPHASNHSAPVALAEAVERFLVDP